MGRFGNQLFIFASVMGIAKNRHLEPTFLSANDIQLPEVFNSLSIKVLSEPAKKYTRTEINCCTYDNLTEKLPCNKGDIQIGGVCQIGFN